MTSLNGLRISTVGESVRHSSLLNALFPCTMLNSEGTLLHHQTLKHGPGDAAVSADLGDQVVLWKTHEHLLLVQQIAFTLCKK